MTTEETTTELITPYGGELVDLMIAPEQLQDALASANKLPSIRLTSRTSCDLELMAVGAFSPLDRFMGKADLQGVMDNMRLTSGHVFPMPIVLPVDDDDNVEEGMEIALRDAKTNQVIATMTVDEKYEWDLDELATKVFGKNDARHPIIAEMHRWGKYFISGPIKMFQLPPHYDFKGERLTPAQTRA